MSIWPMVSIILPTHNRKNTLRDCLLSIRKTTYPNFEVILVDAASTNGTHEMVKQEFPEVKLITAGDIWHGEAQNLGIMSSRGELVLSIEDDYVVEPNWLDVLANALLGSKEVGVVGGKVYFYGKNDLILSAGGKVRLLTGETPSIGNKCRDSPKFNVASEVDYVPVPLVRREVYEKIGLWDPEYFVLFDEVDFCLRARKHGYKVVFIPKAVLWHKVASMSFMGHSDKRIYYFFRNRIRFIIKNFPVVNIFTSLVYNMFLIAILLISFLVLRKQTHVKSLIAAIVWNIQHFKDTLIARMDPFLQSLKRT